VGSLLLEDCRVMKTMDIDIFVNCNWVDAQWHLYSTVQCSAVQCSTVQCSTL